MNIQMHEALAQMRLPPHRIASMILEAAKATGDEVLMERLRTERAYHEQAAYMTQSIVLGFTMAQTMDENVNFERMFDGAELGQNDDGLMKLGKQMVDWMAQEPVAPHAGVAREIFERRVAAMLAAI
jgi:hypothetical protein